VNSPILILPITHSKKYEVARKALLEDPFYNFVFGQQMQQNFPSPRNPLTS
jgi:hypothetical protein